MTRGLKAVVSFAVWGMCLIVPATSQATLVFTRNPLSPTVYVAKDNGSRARKVGAGSNPRVSPDGQTIVFYRLAKGNQPPALMTVPAAGGPARRLASGWQDPFVFAWSADSSTIAVLLGPEVGKRRLTTIDLATGIQQTIATGFFSGVSLRPMAASSSSRDRTRNSGPRATSTGSNCCHPALSASLPCCRLR